MITIQIDSFRDCAAELGAIFPQHHREYGLMRDVMPLAPDWNEYFRREASGELFLTTARRDGTVIAYYIAVVRPGFHYRTTLTGTMDIVYVVPEQRNRGIILPLFRHVEQELRRRGVQVWYSGYKVHNSAGMPRLHELLGFVPADVYCVKWLGERGNAP